MKTFTDFDIYVNGRSGETKIPCPKCSADRKKKNFPCLNVNVDKGVWHCWHCEWSGSLKEGEFNKPEPIKKPKTYSKPVTKNTYELSDFWKSWFSKRGISPEVLKRNKIHNAPVYMPQIESEIDAVIFPFFRNGEMVNCKYRDANKNFRMHGGAERILYGFDDIGETTIWVEGEIDKLSLQTAGFNNVVSVPDGAPSPNTKDFGKKFEYLETHLEKLNIVKTHILAVDNDLPGKKLENELVRRLGADKCRLIHWPDDCKDANDVLVKHGTARLKEAIENSREYPIEGIVQVEDCYESLINLYHQGTRKGLSTGFKNVDEFYTVRPCEWTVISGSPGSGKSEWLDAVMVNMVSVHDWKFAVCSPENQPIEQHITKLLEKAVGQPFSAGGTPRMNVENLNNAIAWLNNSFFFILPQAITLDNILERARHLIKTKGINGLVIDPWNEVEATKPKDLSETEWISRQLAKIRRFARENQIHIWVVAHPVKLQRDKKTDEYPVPTLYDISGSAHWYNKADNGIIVYRQDKTSTKTNIFIQKIRFKAVGKIGRADFDYNRVTGIYTEE